MGPYPLVDAGSAGHSAHDAPGAVAVEPPPVRADQDGARNAFAYGQVERPGRARGEGHGDYLAPLAPAPQL